MRRAISKRTWGVCVAQRGWRRLGAVLLFAFCILTPLQAAQPVHDAASLLQAEALRYNAMVTRDIATLKNVLADEAAYYHTTGWKQTKAEHIDHIATGTAVYRKIEILESKQTVLGDVGFIEGVSQFTAGPDKPISYQLSFITVYVWRDARWQMLTFHCAKIPPEGAKPPALSPPDAGSQPARL